MMTRTTATLTGYDIESESGRLVVTQWWNRLRATAEEQVERLFIARDLKDVHLGNVVIEVVAEPGQPIDLANLTDRMLKGELIGALPFSHALAAEDAARDAHAEIVAQALVAPYIEVAPAEVPGLTGNLVKDVRAFTGLTHEEIASIWGVQSRTIQGVQSGEIPLERYESTLNVLLAIGRILIGGLGKKGVRKWFTIGQPSRLDRIVGGGLDAVHAEARDYMR